MRIKTFIIVLMLFTFLSEISAQSENYGDITFTKAVNISGKQRMLSQKMAKAYLLLTKGITNSEIQKELNSSKFIFKKHLDILKKNASSQAIKLYIKNVEKIWVDFEKLISEAPNYTSAKKIIDINTDLLKACNQVVISIEQTANYSNKFFKSDNKDLVDIINVSGKQRMLSQRLCLYYTASTIFPEEKSNYEKILSNIFAEFDGVIGDLLINDNNTTEIEEEFGSVMGLWDKFRSNQKGFMNNEFALEEVFITTNELTRSFNIITGQYEKLSKE